MPKKIVATEEDPKVVGGMPEHGDTIKLDSSNDDNAGTKAGSAEPKATPKVEEPDWKTELAALNQKLARLEGENAALRTPKQPAPKPQEPDWENMLFDNPKEAVALLKKSIREEVIQDVTNAYKRDQGEKEFWDQFYKTHNDLKDDDDLVRSTLATHMADLADLPVKKASERLADLTRERIMRYTNKTIPKGGKKAVTEGASQPGPGKPQSEPPRPVTLSDIIKARRAKRMNPKATTA